MLSADKISADLKDDPKVSRYSRSERLQEREETGIIPPPPRLF